MVNPIQDAFDDLIDKTLTAAGKYDASIQRKKEWNAKILDPVTAIKWALEQDDDDAMAFLRDWNEGAVFGDEHGEYRYWATGAHEPV